MTTKAVAVVFVHEGARGSVRPEGEQIAMPELIASLEALAKIGALKRVQVWTSEKLG